MNKCSSVTPESQDRNLGEDTRWLEPWRPLLKQKLQGQAVLDLGCGSGIDTA